MQIATALVRMTFVPFVVQKTLQCCTQKRSKSSSVSVSGLKKTPFEHLRKKFLSQILGIGNGVTLAAGESEHRSPVNLAKFGKRSLCLRFITRILGAA